MHAIYKVCMCSLNTLYIKFTCALLSVLAYALLSPFPALCQVYTRIILSMYAI